jgi:hypothetical protein
VPLRRRPPGTGRGKNLCGKKVGGSLRAPPAI